MSIEKMRERLRLLVAALKKRDSKDLRAKIALLRKKIDAEQAKQGDKGMGISDTEKEIFAKNLVKFDKPGLTVIECLNRNIFSGEDAPALLVTIGETTLVLSQPQINDLIPLFIKFDKKHGINQKEENTTFNKSSFQALTDEVTKCVGALDLKDENIECFACVHPF